LAGIGILTV
nr:Chain C, octapeptide from Melan-A/MART-1 [synthetic construct]2GTW_F Chain F, octapeptide from Melan-A/MART-1 [synthetic construct]